MSGRAFVIVRQNDIGTEKYGGDNLQNGKNVGNFDGKSTEASKKKSNRVDFEIYKNNVCYRVKEFGDIDFIIEMLEQEDVHTY